MQEFLLPATWIALGTLTAMEIVLGIDNLIFLSILVGKVEKEKQALARQLGIGLAFFFRLALIFSISWIMGLTEPFFTWGDFSVSGRDLILIGGGLFLVAKATFEIHEKLESGPREELQPGQAKKAFAIVVFQIGLIDIVFSLDSVITAVGMSNHIPVMVIAMMLSMVVMAWAASPVGQFVDRHPTIKILALAFLVLIGTMLLMEGFGNHVNKGYIYFAMAFSFAVEMLNMRVRVPTGKKVELKGPRA